MKYSLLCIVLFLNFNCFAQKNDFQFVVEKIMQNYSGFQDKSDSAKFTRYAQAVMSQNSQDTFKALTIITDFFKDKHLAIRENVPNPNIDRSSCQMQYSKVLTYLNGSQKKKQFEGFWLNDYNDCVIGLIQTGTSPISYKAFVIEAIDSSYVNGLRLLNFEKQIKPNTFFTEGINLYSKRRIFRNVVFRNDSVFTLEELGKWKKLARYDEPILKSLPQFNYLSSAKQINDSTYLFKISGCTTRDYQIIDSIVKADAIKIKRATNLIVDISNNLGGSSSVVWPILPFIFTNPIAKHVTSFYSTEDNIQERTNTIEEYKLRPNYDTQYVKYMNEWIAYWRENLNIFTTNHADTFRYDSIYAKPKNVGLIINYACQSASELIILMFKQSKKVTVFGERTMGAIDYLDFYALNTPSNKYSLYAASTKRVISPGGKKYDGIGIYPDVTIPDTVADWQQFVVEYYQNHK